MKGTEPAFISLCSELQHLWVNPDCPWHDCLPEPRGWWIWSSINREAGKEADSFPRGAANCQCAEAGGGGVMQPMWHAAEHCRVPEASLLCGHARGTRAEHCENWYRLLWAASAYLQPLWTVHYIDMSIFHVPARCPPASLPVIPGQETRSTLKPRTDLLSLETAHQPWLPHPCNWNLCK